MQLQEIKNLLEYDAIGKIMVTRHGDGWILMALKKDKEKQVNINDCALELSRGGLRIFKTLDAIEKLTRSQLYCASFQVS